MSKPPKVVIPGLNRGSGVPGGYIVGRLKGRGPAQLLGLIGLRTAGVATAFGVVTSNSQTQSVAHSETVSLSTAVSSSLSSVVSTDVTQSTSLSQISSSLSSTNSTNVTQSTSLSQISSSLSGAISSTTSLSTAVSTVISGSISTVTSMVNSLSAASGGGGGGGVTRPSVIQVAGSIGNNFNVTMGSTPTAGNFLIAFCSHWNNLTGAGTNWTLVENSNGASVDGIACALKVASSTDTTALVPFVGGVGGSSVVVYEIQGALTVLPLNKILAKEDTTTPFDIAITASRASSVLLGAVFEGGANTAFTISSYTADLNITGTAANNSPRRTQGIHLDTSAGTSGTISLTFSGGNFGAYILELLGG